MTAGLCWYNNMLQGRRMQNPYGSTEAINVNGTEISPLVTWDSKITTVLAMLGGVGDLVKSRMRAEEDLLYGSVFKRFVFAVDREYRLEFSGNLSGGDVPLQLPENTIPNVLSQWELSCAKY